MRKKIQPCMDVRARPRLPERSPGREVLGWKSRVARPNCELDGLGRGGADVDADRWCGYSGVVAPAEEGGRSATREGFKPRDLGGRSATRIGTLAAAGRRLESGPWRQVGNSNRDLGSSRSTTRIGTLVAETWGGTRPATSATAWGSVLTHHSAVARMLGLETHGQRGEAGDVWWVGDRMHAGTACMNGMDVFACTPNERDREPRPMNVLACAARVCACIDEINMHMHRVRACMHP